MIIALFTWTVEVIFTNSCDILLFLTQNAQTSAKDEINLLNKQIQALQSDLNKKDYDLQVYMHHKIV